jgi:hypothetical protein
MCMDSSNDSIWYGIRYMDSESSIVLNERLTVQCNRVLHPSSNVYTYITSYGLKIN